MHQDAVIRLPAPVLVGSISLEAALCGRRSVREFDRTAVRLDQISQLLWAAQGITHTDGFRTAPSAGALYPLELALAVGNVDGLSTGVYRYKPQQHELERALSDDVRPGLSAASGAQECVSDAAAVFVFSALYGRTTRKYGDRGVRYVHIEVGLAAQGLGLEAVALGLGAVLVGSFDDTRVRRLIASPRDHRPMILMPVGYER